jgi:hypothetical protein
VLIFRNVKIFRVADRGNRVKVSVKSQAVRHARAWPGASTPGRKEGSRNEPARSRQRKLENPEIVERLNDMDARAKPGQGAERVVHAP